jgi:hypothetical protein
MAVQYLVSTGHTIIFIITIVDVWSFTFLWYGMLCWHGVTPHKTLIFWDQSK